MPSDKLIFGWQAPMAGLLTINGWNGNAGPTLNMAAGVYKLYLVGSYIRTVGREDIEYHEISNAAATSITVNEGVR